MRKITVALYGAVYFPRWYTMLTTLESQLQDLPFLPSGCGGQHTGKTLDQGLSHDLC
jgi:hypothetical protein